MSDEDEGVGYKRPPRETRFRPGKSPNPGGRPKGARSFAHDLLEELRENITVMEGGQQKAVSKQRLAARALVAAAMKGSIPAATVLMTFAAKAQGDENDSQATSGLTEDDRDVRRARRPV